MESSSGAKHIIIDAHATSIRIVGWITLVMLKPCLEGGAVTLFRQQNGCQDAASKRLWKPPNPKRPRHISKTSAERGCGEKDARTAGARTANECPVQIRKAVSVTDGQTDGHKTLLYLKHRAAESSALRERMQ
jgi:hypothetical protein